MKRNFGFLSRNSLRNLFNIVCIEQPIKNVPCRKFSSKEGIERRSRLFSMEQKRQKEAVGRIEKIEVKYLGSPNDQTLIVNKDLSTPFDCAKHLGTIYTEKSAVALLDGNTLWDMHRPLPNSCTLQLLDYMSPEPQQVNRAFWRTCSFALGAVLSAAFKDNVNVVLHSFPSPDVRSGSFVYDAQLYGLEEWTPTATELRALSAELVKKCRQDCLMERLAVAPHLALDMFQDNEHKSKQIPDIANKSNGVVTLYRAGDHVDISKGPMISRLSQMGRVTMCAVHRLLSRSEDSSGEVLHRFQGVALPAGLVINHMAYRILEERAAKLNPARSPFEPFTLETDERLPSQAVA